MQTLVWALIPLFLFACASKSDPRPADAPVLGTHVDAWRDRIIYQVVVDRFENGDPTNDMSDGVGPDPFDLKRHQGGDWLGLRRRLDYIAELGATALWISPIVANVPRTPREDGYHGYWASDFTELNPRFGDLEDLRALVREAHARGIAVIIDVVTNHTGRVFNYDLNADGTLDRGEVEPPYRPVGYEVPLLWSARPRLFTESGMLTLGPEHFRRRGFGDVFVPEQKRFGDFPTGLRDLATEREDVRAALVETYVRWVRETDVDGFRIDAVPHVEEAFWPDFGARVRRALAALGKERFLLLGEVFTPDADEVARYSAPDGGLDNAFDLPLKFALFDGFLLDGRPASEAAAALTRPRSFRTTPQPGGIGADPWASRVLVFDNHDTWRFRAELDADPVVRLALLLLFTLEGIPCLYYGTEQDFRGEGEGQQRERMWDSHFRTDGATYRWVRELMRLRSDSVALRRGTMSLRYAAEADGRSDAPDAGLLAFERSAEGESLLVVVNGHALKESRARIPSGFAAGERLRDRLGAEGRWETNADGSLEVILAPRTGLVLEAR